MFERGREFDMSEDPSRVFCHYVSTFINITYFVQYTVVRTFLVQSQRGENKLSLGGVR